MFMLLFLLFGLCHGLYDDDDDVVQLTSDNFNRITSGPELWLVKFYASWCAHCEELSDIWKQIATHTRGLIKIGAVDNEKFAELGSRFNVQSYPTILAFGANRAEPSKYDGARDIQNIINFAFEKSKELVYKRLHQAGINMEESYSEGSCGSRSGFDDSSSDTCGGRQSKSHSSTDESSGDEVIQLTESNFDSRVLQSDEPWLVEFFAPWCGHCKNLKPHWDKAAKKLKNKFKLGAVDATIYQDLAQRYSVRGFPTIKYFPAGSKSGEAVEYDGGRTADDIVQWALDKFIAIRPPAEILELLSYNTLKAACSEKQLCIIAFLPDLLDCQSSCRTGYISILKTVSEKFKQFDWGWLWTGATIHHELENVFSLGGFGYPAIVALNARKAKCAIMRGPFSDAGIQEFLRDLSLGRGSTPLVSISGLPSINTVEPWDGKDVEAPIEDEIDLSELEDTKTEL